MNEQIRKFAFESANGLLRFDERGFMLYEDEVEKFAELVRADEREACAKVCEKLGMATNGMYERNHECAQAIRARGDAIDISQERVDETAKHGHEFEEMVKRGTKAWADTPDDWVDELRGGADKQEPDDIYDVWKEKNNG